MSTTSRFHQLRNRHPVLVFKRFVLDETAREISARFEFELSPDIRFAPMLRLLKPPAGFLTLPEKRLTDLLLHMGLVESISYWKCACPPTLRIECGSLSEDQIRWWEDLFIHGLGEFFFVNQIDSSNRDLIRFDVSPPSSPDTASLFQPPATVDLIPIGGGKDSAVALEILKDRIPSAWALMLNPVPAMTRTARAGGIPSERFMTVHRTIDPVLLELNRKGYLNGHTPFSAYLAFLGILCAHLLGCRNVILSNEHSADFANTLHYGRPVNHQYSKSLEFERKFSSYVSRHLDSNFRYFSILRPFNELHIARIFGGIPRFWHAFRSCNVGREQDRWCGSCPKCLFTYSILSPFLPADQLQGLFGADLLSKEELLPLLQQLVGAQGIKPFDCIGTEGETRMALKLFLTALLKDGKPVPSLLRRTREHLEPPAYSLSLAPAERLYTSRDHNIPSEFEELLKPWISLSESPLNCAVTIR